MRALKWIRLITSLALLLILALPAVADDVFVGNKPYKGATVGSGDGTRFVLQELAEALDVYAEKAESGWTIAGKPVKTTEEEGAIWVALSDLPAELFEVVVSKELGTIDLFLKREVMGEVEKTWSGDGTLVVFYASWSEACTDMDRTFMTLYQSPIIDLQIVDVDFPKEEAYKKYTRRYFEGDRLPYFVVLDSRGRKIHSFDSFHTYTALLEELKKAFTKKQR